MSNFILGFIAGGLSVFFIIGWCWVRMFERIEPRSDSKPAEDIAA